MIISDSITAEYETLTTGSGCVELKSWTTVSMTGADRQLFLHNMCTNHIKRLTPGTGCEAFCTDVKGKIVAHVFVIAREDRLDLLMVPDQVETFINHLDRYIIREDVQLVDKTDKVSWLVLAGSATEAKLTDLGVTDIAELQDVWKHADAKIGGVDCLIVRSTSLWPNSFLLQCPSDQQPAVLGRLQESSISVCSAEALDVLRIEAGTPLFDIDFTSSHLPQEVDRDAQTINFNKGCYLGQETVARIDALGQVNRKVTLLQFVDETVPAVGLELSTPEKGVGEVTSGCWSLAKKAPLALAMIRRGANAVGKQLDSELGAAEVLAKD